MPVSEDKPAIGQTTVRRDIEVMQVILTKAISLKRTGSLPPAKKSTSE